MTYKRIQLKPAPYLNPCLYYISIPLSLTSCMQHPSTAAYHLHTSPSLNHLAEFSFPHLASASLPKGRVLSPGETTFRLNACGVTSSS